MPSPRRRAMLPVAGIAMVLTLGAPLGHAASAVSVAPRRAMTLLQDGTIEPLEQLNQTALADHPRGTIVATRLDRAGDRYVYRVRLRDAAGKRWRVSLNAASGDIIGQTRITH